MIAVSSYGFHIESIYPLIYYGAFNCTEYVPCEYTVRSESRCALRLWYVDLVVNIEVAVEVCCCFTVFSC
jgi:hypothetical protein